MAVWKPFLVDLSCTFEDVVHVPCTDCRDSKSAPSEEEVSAPYSGRFGEIVVFLLVESFEAFKFRLEGVLVWQLRTLDNHMPQALPSGQVSLKGLRVSLVREAGLTVPGGRRVAPIEIVTVGFWRAGSRCLSTHNRRFPVSPRWSREISRLGPGLQHDCVASLHWQSRLTVSLFHGGLSHIRIAVAQQ